VKGELKSLWSWELSAYDSLPRPPERRKAQSASLTLSLDANSLYRKVCDQECMLLNILTIFISYDHCSWARTRLSPWKVPRCFEIFEKYFGTPYYPRTKRQRNKGRFCLRSLILWLCPYRLKKTNGAVLRERSQLFVR